MRVFSFIIQSLNEFWNVGGALKRSSPIERATAIPDERERRRAGPGLKF